MQRMRVCEQHILHSVPQRLFTTRSYGRLRHRAQECSNDVAMFAMFFGSGNLIFPLKIGAYSGENYLIAGLGFFFTAVIVPFTKRR